MLTFNDVTKEFRLDDRNTIAPVRGVSLQVQRGEVIVITGRSGTGKTTLLNLAAGLVRPTSGQVLVDDNDLSRMTDQEVSALRGQKIGFIFQFPSLLPALTIIDNVSLPAVFGSGEAKAEAGDRAEELLGGLGLASKAGVHPKQLSAGEQKRVVIARSLINNPELVLADEPTSDLDSRTEKEVMAFFRDVNKKGVTFLIVTHNLDLIAFATRAFEMERGNIRMIKGPGRVVAGR